MAFAIVLIVLAPVLAFWTLYKIVRIIEREEY